MTRRGTILVLFLVAAMAAPAAGGALAARATCPGQGNAGAPSAAQEQAMLCLVNHARQGRGLEPLASLTSLNRAADRKSGDISAATNSATKLAAARSPTG